MTDTDRAWRAAVGFLLGCVVLATAGSAAAQGPAPGQPGAGAALTDTRTTWYFYTVTWGSQDEFLDLFQKNHYPVLKAQLQAGRFAAVRAWIPRYHGDGRADWTFVVEIVERVGVTGIPSEQEFIAKLYPDQATFRKEEQRRFELLVAHWDVPLNPVEFDTRTPSR